MTRELAESISLRRALIVASGFVLFGVAGLVFNVAMLMKLRRRL